MLPHAELDFLQHLDADLKTLLRSARWLQSDFNAQQWEASFEKKLVVVNWHVWIGDSLLTAEENRELLEGLKYYLLCAVDGNGVGLRASAEKQRRNFSDALTIIDYLIIHAEQLELRTAGLGGLTYNDLTALLYQFGTHSLSSESIYSYSSRATDYILGLTAATSAGAIAGTRLKFPSMKEIQEDDLNENSLDIAPRIVPTIRAALYHHGYYSGSPRDGFHLNGKRLSEELYPNTLAGTRIKPRFRLLSFFPHEKSYRREHEGVSVRYLGDGKVSAVSYKRFRATLCCLGTLHLLELPAPPLSDLAKIKNFTIPLAPDKRFRSVPSPIVLSQFKNCVEFHFKYGQLIIDGFCRLAAYCKSSGATMHRLPDKQVRKIIGPDLVDLGVKKLGLASRQLNTTRSKPSKEDYFTNLRSNEGLIELVQIYIGCVQFVLGTLMARRYNELTELPLINCLDKSKEWLILDLEKSSKGLFGIRDTQGRPIDPLPVAMIRLLVRMQRLLKRFGFIENYKRLFATPSTVGYKGLIDASTESWNRNLNIICDYFQTPLDKLGRRYYIRQHQLRRFFALMFFHTYGFGGTNALRWMLGHQDIEHVYRYIRATVDGASLRGAMSQSVLEEMSMGRMENYQDLADLLKARFGTATFGLYDEEEADLYLQSKLDEGSITIEPVFFTDEHGKQMKIVVRVFSKIP